MKKTNLIIILIALAVITILLIRGCYEKERYRKLGEWKGKYNALTQAFTEEREELEKEVVQKEEKILGLKNEIIEIQAKEVQVREDIKVKDAEIERLKQEFSLIPAEDKDKQIFNLQLQVKKLEGKVERIIDSRDNAMQEAVKWKYTYEIQVGITVDQANIIKGLEKRLGAADAYVYALEKDKKGLSLKFTLKNILYTGGAFLGGYFLGGLT